MTDRLGAGLQNQLARFNSGSALYLVVLNPVPYKDPEQRRKYAREWIARRRAEWFADKVCARCGVTEDLRLDHIDPRLKVDHRIWSWSQVRRDVELAKCQVLCYECHTAKTWEQMPITNGTEVVEHGTNAMYDHYGCHCDPCKEAQKKRKRSYRERHPRSTRVASGSRL